MKQVFPTVFSITQLEFLFLFPLSGKQSSCYVVLNNILIHYCSIFWNYQMMNNEYMIRKYDEIMKELISTDSSNDPNIKSMHSKYFNYSF